MSYVSADKGVAQVPIGLAMVEEVREFLANLRLEEIADAMVVEGLDDMDTVVLMDDKDLKALVPKVGHRKRLEAALKKIQGQAHETNQAAAEACECRDGSGLQSGAGGLSAAGLLAGEGEDVAVAPLSAAEAGVTVAATLARKAVLVAAEQLGREGSSDVEKLERALRRMSYFVI